MQSNLIKVGTAIILLSLSIGVMAQTTKAVYEYDSNGNRTSTIVIPFSQQNAPTQAAEDEISIDPENSLGIKIFPNPTEGCISLDFENVTYEQLSCPGNTLGIWDMQGKLLWENHELKSSNSIDLTGYSNGIYFIGFTLCGSTKSYKIIKY